MGGRVIHRENALFPKYFLDLEDPPQQIYVLGELPSESSLRLGIVGSREIDHFSRRWMNNHLSQLIDNPNLVTISGGARGVDELSHRISLRHCSPTVMVLPSGILNPYPKSRWDDYSSIIETGGCIISEFPLEKPVRKYHFLQRNRLIAALSQVLLVVQAGVPSGTLISAKWAMDLSRQVAVLPSFPGDPLFSGNLKLIFEGAQPIRDYEDLRVLLQMYT